MKPKQGGKEQSKSKLTGSAAKRQLGDELGRTTGSHPKRKLGDTLMPKWQKQGGKKGRR